VVTEIDPKLEICLIEDVRLALSEDLGAGDLTADLVPADQQATARLTIREEAVICGTPWFNEVFRRLDKNIRIDWLVTEGARAKADTVICELAGSARTLLTGERTAMNFLQTLSATATLAASYVQAVAGTRVTILDTRKTIPGLRLAQKYAVRTGGASNHRVGLYDGILIKENHIMACGGIDKAVAVALETSTNVLVEVEVESLDEARAAIEAGAHRLLLDNFTTEMMREAVALRDQLNTDVGLEASGNMNLDTVRPVAETGVDFISIGGLTKDVRAVDLSMRFDMQ